MSCPKCGGAPKRVYHAIWSYAPANGSGPIVLTVAELAAFLGLTRPPVRRSIRELERCGHIRTRVGANGEPSQYTLFQEAP